MIVDCHYHFEQQLLTKDQLLRKMDACEVDKVALMGVINEPIPKPPEFLLNIFRFALTHRLFRFIAKLMADNFTAEGDIKIPTGTFHIYPNPANEPVFQAASDHPDRFLGWVFVNPRGKTDPIQELDKWKDQPGFIGVKSHPFWHRYPPIDLLAVALELAKLNKPLLMHPGWVNHGDFDALLQKVPDLKLILAHAGFPLYADTWQRIKSNNNVYVDLSQTSYLDDRTTRQAVKYLGVERCLFGTDGPYGVHGDDGAFDYAFIKKRIERLFPDMDDQRKLLGLNFFKLIQQS